MALDQLDIRVAQATEYDADDTLGVQADAYGGSKAGCQMIEQHHPFGFKSRAADPDADGTGCQLHTAYEGSRQHAWLSHDPRMAGKIPNIAKGESLQYGFAGNFVRCHLDGAISMMTTDKGGDPSGQSVYQRVTPTEFMRLAPWGSEKFSERGYHLITHSGARLDIGGVGGVPVVGSYFAVRAGMATFNVNAATFGIGAEPLVKVSGIVALIEALITAFGTITAGSSTTGGAPAAASLAAAQSALVLAMQSIVSGA